MLPTMTYRPPPGWTEVPSRLDGIVVFAPPAPDAPDAPFATACDACGAVMAFDPADQALVCTGCGATQRTGPAVGSLARADGNTFTLEALKRGARGWGVERKVLHCEGCGGELLVDSGALSATCPFCASHQVELVAVDPDAVRPGYVLPFAVTGVDLAPRVEAWLGRGWMHPRSLKDLARVEKFVGVYAPWWVFDARTRASYTCEVGTERTVTRRDSKGRTTTRRVTTWRWVDGALDRHWTGVKIPGTSRLSAILLDRLQEGFDTGACVAYDPTVLAGFQAQSYDIALPEAWEQGRARIRLLAKGACEAHAKRGGGHRTRNLTLNASLDDEVWRYVLLPVWVSAYRFGDRVWVVLVNGQTGAIEGQKPVVWWRVYAAILVSMAPAVCSGIAGIPLSVVGVGIPLLIVAFVLMVFGIVVSVWVWQTAVASEAA